ncbi:hypothetical protein DSM106972_022350 [Dulcicalothrix desertica PCC 7102]|uniref:Carboxypeptidase regulatory-like domain-containing protein n=1 Tax=Dulcicalothrix desertica PCC 7102 TaxID=232991 RepID=A0A3S5K3E3_9CYAN|nr:carboxypeptidase regulatory-like domain-containing protein [Dulcicalothrix desertica]RUT06974.1 hypothetical protein DSM106972_022350 [Dulcicalothrix desertica PCC 7102]TWH62025.1 hypothetical protein CAL7102_00714 [Dulcicalothrix desertica PCC 7102]
MSKKSVINYIGRVIDYRKEAPIRGAKVSLRTDDISLTSYTDLEGIYKFQISPDKSKNVRAEIFIEASGYKSYGGFINLAPDKKDLGDIRLGAPNNQQSSQQSNQQSSQQSNQSSSRQSKSDSNLTPVIAVIMIAFFVLLSLSLRNSPRRSPVYDRTPRSDSFDDLR